MERVEWQKRETTDPNLEAGVRNEKSILDHPNQSQDHIPKVQGESFTLQDQSPLLQERRRRKRRGRESILGLVLDWGPIRSTILH